MVPAYGRDYQHAKDVASDWLAGKDFMVQEVNGRGGYINLEDAKSIGDVTLNVRYSNLRMVTQIVIKNDRGEST